MLLAACARKPPEPFDPTLGQRQTFLCCNLHFNADDDATDANYDVMPGGTLVPIGTLVRATAVGSNVVRFRVANDLSLYTLELRFGRKAITPSKYFSQIFLDQDPKPKLDAMEPATRDAILRGEVVVGMTRDEVIMARGYPPLHHTNGYDSNEWIFYNTGSTVENVRFAQGRVVAVNTSAAP